MNIACSIYVLIAVSFLCTVSADESSAPRETGNLAKRVKINTRNIDANERKILKSKAILESKVSDLEGEDEIIDRKIMALKEKTKELLKDVSGAVLEIDGKLNDSNQHITDQGNQFKKTFEELNGDLLKLDETFTNADVEVEGKIVELKEEIADLDVQLNATTDDLNDLDGAVTGVEEKIKFLKVDVLKLDKTFTNADVEVKGKVTELNEEITDLGGQLKTTIDDLNDLDGAVTGVEEKIKFLKVDVLKLDEKFTNADVEVEGKVAYLNEEIADLGGQLNTTTDDLNDLDKAVTGLEEKVDGAVIGLEEKVDGAVIGLEEKVTGAVTGLEEKIKLLEEALEVTLKMGEIQFFGVASQSSTHKEDVATNCIDGMKSDIVRCHTLGEDNEWWKLTFTKDVVINRIMIYSESRMQYTAGNRVSILSATGDIVWEHTIEKEEKPVYVIAVPNIVGQYVKIDKALNGYVIMREVAVFGRYD